MVMAESLDNDFSEDEPYMYYYADARSIAGQDIYIKIKKGVWLIIKVARAGATTTLALESFIIGEKCVIITANNKIAKETVIEGIIALCKEKGLPIPKIVHVPANQECIYYQEDLGEVLDELNILKKEYEELKQGVQNGNATNEELKKKQEEYRKCNYTYFKLKKLKVIPKGEDCGYDCRYFDECPCMKVLSEEADIIVLTYDKIVNMQRVLRQGKRSNSVNKEILELIKECKNVILDEAHIVDREPPSVTIDTAEKVLNGDFLELFKAKITEEEREERTLARKKKNNDENDEKENNKKYPALANLIRTTYKLFSSSEIQTAIRKSRKLANSKDRAKIQNKVIVGRPIKQEQNTKSKSKKLKELAIFGAVLHETYQLIKSKDATKYKHDINEINDLLDYATLLNEKKYIITTDTIHGKLVTKIASSRNTTHYYLGDFLRQMQATGNYRIFINSATHGDFDFKRILKRDTIINEIEFGEGGDPLNTMEKMKIFPVDMNLSTNSHWYNSIQQQLHKLVEILIFGLDTFGSEGCFFCTMNTENAQLIENELLKLGYNQKVHFYRGSETMGVSVDARFGVFIGASYVPINSKYYAKNREEQENKALEDMWNAFIQAMHRVKDPKGEKPSAVVAITSREDIEDIINHSTCGGKLKAPDIIPCYTDGKVDYQLIRAHMLWEDTKESCIETMEIQNRNHYQENKSTQNSETSAVRILENINSNSQQSNSSNHFSFSKRNINIYEVVPKALYYIYEGCDLKKFSTDMQSEENFGFGRGYTIQSEHSDSIFNSEVDESSGSDYDFRKLGIAIKEGKEPLVTELYFSEVEVKVCGFTGLQLHEIKPITAVLDSKGIRPLILKNLKNQQQTDATKIKNESYSIHIITQPCLAKTAISVCKDTLDKVMEAGLKIKCEIFPKYSSRKNAITNGCNEYRLPFFKGEQAYDYKTKQFVGYSEDLKVVINDLVCSVEFNGKGNAILID